jgi:O-acetyl-ADP-ribose deacetylase
VSEISVIQGDITKLKVDAIVNAANSSLLGGGGVDGAIHRAGGPAILEACMEIRKKQGGCPTGQAVITTGGTLPAQYVIHTVGPVWHGGNKNEDVLLKDCYVNSLRLAEENKVNSLAFPNISTGVYHFPKERAAAIAVNAVRQFLADHFVPSQIIFACFDQENYTLYRRLLNE